MTKHYATLYGYREPFLLKMVSQLVISCFLVGKRWHSNRDFETGLQTGA